MRADGSWLPILLPLREDRADFVIIAGCSLHFLDLPDGVPVLFGQLGQKPGVLAAVDILGQHQRKPLELLQTAAAGGDAFHGRHVWMPLSKNFLCVNRRWTARSRRGLREGDPPHPTTRRR